MDHPIGLIRSVIMAIFSPLFGRLSDRVEPPWLATGGMALTAMGMALFTTLHSSTTIHAIVGNPVLFGFALVSSPNISAIMGAVAKKDYGIVSGNAATMRLLGQMLSMTVATVVLSLLIGHRAIAPERYDRFLTSTRVMFTISAALCSVGIFFF